MMETTFDKFMNSDPKRKEKFDKEYNEFLLSELALEKAEHEEGVRRNELRGLIQEGIGDIENGKALTEEDVLKNMGVALGK